MKQLIAFDVDGIFKQEQEQSEYVAGQLDAEKIDVMYNDGINSKCVIVSSSPYYPKKNGKSLWELYAKNETNDMRYKNLLDSVSALTDNVDLKLYVSDNGDYDQAEKAGFIYVDVNDFQKIFEEKADLNEYFSR